MGKAQIGEYQQSPPTLRKRANSLISGAFSLFSHTFPILFLHGSRMALVLGHGFEAGMGDLVTDRGRLGYGLLMGYGGGIVPVGWGIGVVVADFCGRSGFELPKSSSAEENKRNCLDKAFLLWYSFLAGRGGAGTVLPEQGAFPRLSGVTPLMALGNAATHDGCSLSIPRRRINRRDRPYQRAFPSCASKNWLGASPHALPIRGLSPQRFPRVTYGGFWRGPLRLPPQCEERGFDLSRVLSRVRVHSCSPFCMVNVLQRKAERRVGPGAP